MRYVRFYKKYGIYVLLLIEMLVFAFIAPNFLSVRNILNVLRQISMLGIVSAGITYVMMAGAMDLSVGGQMAVTGLLTALMMNRLGLHPAIAVLGALIIGTAMGGLNGLIGVKFKIEPMIVTLGTMIVWEGAAYVITGGYPVFDFSEGFAFIGQGYIGPIPFPVVIMAVVVGIAAFILNKTYFGRYVIALGGNQEAARLAGVDVNRLMVTVYCVSGFFTAIASVILLSRTNSAQPGAGASYAFDCITASVLGGVSVKGGKGNIWGTVVGVIFIGVLNNAFLLMNMNESYQDVFKGIILLIAVALDNMDVGNKVNIIEERD